MIGKGGGGGAGRQGRKDGYLCRMAAGGGVGGVAWGGWVRGGAKR